MNTARTYDQIALGYLLQGKAIPQSLMDEAAAAAGDRCPECGSRHTEDNGGREYRCAECDHRWGHDGGERYGF